MSGKAGSVAKQTPTQARRAEHVRRASVRAKVRRTVAAVVDANEHLALDSELDRRQLVRKLVQALVP